MKFKTTMIELNSAAKHTAGFHTIDCDIISKTHFAFTMREDYTQWKNWKEGKTAPEEEKLKKRIVELDLTKPEGEKWTSYDIEGFKRIRISSTLTPNSYVAMTNDATGFEVSFGDVKHMYEKLPNIRNGNIRRGIVLKAKFHEGSMLAVTSDRQLLRLNHEKQWTVIGNEMPKHEDMYDSGFRDFDLFSLDDIYAVGGVGDVWHYNGTEWQQIDFPTNDYVRTVCCGGDGYVYITVDSATIYKGRGNDWELIHEEEVSLYFDDAVWYEDKMWCTNDYGIWTLDNGKFEKAEDVPTRVKVGAGNLAVRDGVLLVAGFYGAACKKDGEWILLHNHHDVLEFIET